MPPVGTPRDGVGDANTTPMLSHPAVRIYAIKNTVLTALFDAASIGPDVVAHRADPERTPWIGSSVIEANLRPALQSEELFETPT
jgi:hypothetical protein